jgi:lysozyme
MKPSQKIIDFIKGYEKESLVAYMPTPNDKPTISFGLTFYPDGKPVKMGDKITKAQSEEYFKKVLDKFADSIGKFITAKLTQQQFDALLSLSYNIGIQAFKDSTLLKKLNLNPLDKVIPEWFRTWRKQGSAVLQGLVKRREAEVQIYTKGIYDSKH